MVSESLETARRQALEPDADPIVLQQICAQYPQLRSIVALNPMAYPALLEWLASLDDPSVNVALQQREQRAALETGQIPAFSPQSTTRQTRISNSLEPVQLLAGGGDPQ